MTFEVTDANGSFVLALRDDRQTPKYASYVVRFTNTDGRANRDPVKYPIEVLRDYDPEVSLVAPREKILDVRLDETVTIEVDARDPDFALSEVRLRGQAAGRPDINAPLLAAPHVGQYSGRYVFKPKDHQLRAGDIVHYWATANDNRAPAANSAASERQTIRIIAPDPARQPPPQQVNRNDPRNQPDQQGKQDTNSGESATASGRSEQQGNAPNQQPDAKSDSKNEKQRPGEQTTGGQGKQNEQGQAGGAEQQPGQANDAKRNEKQDEQTGAGAAGSGGSNETTRPGGDRTDATNPSQPSGDNARGNPDAQQSPVSSKGDNDAEAIQKIRDHLQKKNELNEEEQPQDGQSQNGAANSADGKSQADGQASKQPNQQPGSDRGNNGGERGRGDAQRGDGSSKPGQPASDRPSDGKSSEGKASDGKSLHDKAADGKASDGKATAGRPTSSNDPSGKSDAPGEDQRVRNPQPGKTPDQKWEQKPSDASPGGKQDPGATGRRNPNSAGEQGGELPEGSKDSVTNKQVNREGVGETGQSQSADKGAGESGERGAGNNSSDKGGDVKANKETGQRGSQTPGKGSSVREGQGDQPGGKSGSSPGEKGDAKGATSQQNQQDNKGDTQGDAVSEGGPAGKQDSKSNGDQGQPADGKGPATSKGQPGAERGMPGKGQAPTDAADAPTGDGDQLAAPSGSGGQRGTGAMQPRQAAGEAPDADAANLEYARKQTDLILEKLSDQLNRKQVDREMLKDLGWSEDELRKFVARWNERKEAARRADPAADEARRNLDDALRSLGLRRGPLRQIQAKDDNQRDLKAGHRGAVPLEYQERLRDYNRGISRSQRGGGEK
jgi:hypothetical protein